MLWLEPHARVFGLHLRRSPFRRDFHLGALGAGQSCRDRRPDPVLWRGNGPAACRLGRINHGGRAIALNAEVSRQALVIAYLNDFWLLMVLTVVAIPLVYLLHPNPKGGPAPAPVLDH